ncbi:unnamed protein product [Closterium sp. Yama58-4]|nr:unnamed protein product [Closterium sp. Yama58-4]
MRDVTSHREQQAVRVQLVEVLLRCSQGKILSVLIEAVCDCKGGNVPVGVYRGNMRDVTSHREQQAVRVQLVEVLLRCSQGKILSVLIEAVCVVLEEGIPFQPQGASTTVPPVLESILIPKAPFPAVLASPLSRFPSSPQYFLVPTNDKEPVPPVLEALLPPMLFCLPLPLLPSPPQYFLDPTNDKEPVPPVLEALLPPMLFCLPLPLLPSPPQYFLDPTNDKEPVPPVLEALLPPMLFCLPLPLLPSPPQYFLDPTNDKEPVPPVLEALLPPMLFCLPLPLLPSPPQYFLDPTNDKEPVPPVLEALLPPMLFCLPLPLLPSPPQYFLDPTNDKEPVPPVLEATATHVLLFLSSLSSLTPPSPSPQYFLDPTNDKEPVPPVLEAIASDLLLPLITAAATQLSLSLFHFFLSSSPQYFLDPTNDKEPVPPVLEAIASDLLLPIMPLMHHLIAAQHLSHRTYSCRSCHSCPSFPYLASPACVSCPPSPLAVPHAQQPNPQAPSAQDEALLLILKTLHLSVQSHMPSAIRKHIDSIVPELLLLLSHCPPTLAAAAAAEGQEEGEVMDGEGEAEGIGAAAVWEVRLKGCKRALQICHALASRHQKLTNKHFPAMVDGITAIVCNSLWTSQGWKVVAPQFAHLLEAAIFPVLCLHPQDLELWEEDEEEYVRRNLPTDLDDMDEIESYDPRQCAAHLLALIATSKVWCGVPSPSCCYVHA